MHLFHNLQVKPIKTQNPADMHEDFLQYLWKHRLYKAGHYFTEDGEQLEIIHPGFTNTDAGPDFFNAKIRIGDTLWAGNVEMHPRASDWIRHKHHKDKAYDNVILHVVGQYDSAVHTSNGSKIAAWVMPIPEHLYRKYIDLSGSSKPIACGEKLNNLDHLTLNSWIERMAVEKLENKVEQIKVLCDSYNGDWDEVFYILLTRNFGFGINSQPFERMARNTPWRIVLKNRDDIRCLEALLLGQAGMLEEAPDDEYVSYLKYEYKILRAKYGLCSVPAHHWKFLRLRPSNFPSVRLAQLAALFSEKQLSLGRLLSAASITEALDLLDISATDYWTSHYRPGLSSCPMQKRLGTQSAELICINTIIPLTFAYGSLRADEKQKDKALSWLESIKPERNAIIDRWKTVGIEPVSALQSQALVHLHQNYCTPKRCIHCRIGHSIIASHESA